jgi:hypothetical protein
MILYKHAYWCFPSNYIFIKYKKFIEQRFNFGLI